MHYASNSTESTGALLYIAHDSAKVTSDRTYSLCWVKSILFGSKQKLKLMFKYYVFKVTKIKTLGFKYLCLKYTKPNRLCQI